MSSLRKVAGSIGVGALFALTLVFFLAALLPVFAVVNIFVDTRPREELKDDLWFVSGGLFALELVALVVWLR